MEGVDLVSAGYRAYHEERIDGKTHYTCFYESPKEGNEDFTAERMLERLFEIGHYQGYVWNKCFRMEIIRQHRLWFHEDISYNEDRLFAVEYLACARRARMLGENRYHYILHEGNAVSASMESSLRRKSFTEIEAFPGCCHIWQIIPGPWPSPGKYGPAGTAVIRENDRSSRICPLPEEQVSLSRQKISEAGISSGRRKRKKLCRKLIWYGWTGICYGQKEQMD